MNHLTRAKFYDKERKQRSKEEIRHLQEVTRPNLSRMGTQKRRPFLTAWLVAANTSHVFLDGTFTYTKSQFQQFPSNSFSTPKSIVRGHLSDQGNRFLSDLRRARNGL